MQTEHVVTIEKIISGGLGLARRQDGLVIMVPFVLPGEQVRVRESKRFSGHIMAEPVAIITPSPERHSPDCPLFGRCGGCHLRHGSIGIQLGIKDGIIRETLDRFGLRPDQEPIPACPSPRENGYRHRIRLHLDRRGRLGFHPRRSHQVIPVRSCPLATPPINHLLERLQAKARELTPWIREMELSCSPLDQGLHLRLWQRSSAPPPESLLTSPAFPALKSLVLSRGKKNLHLIRGEQLGQSFTVCGIHYTLTWDACVFFQANPLLNQIMVEEICTLAGAPERPILDLYCGMGNFSIPLALLGHQVEGVESNPLSIHNANHNRKTLGLASGQARFIQADVGKYLRARVRDNARPPELILLDPPRRGLGKDAVHLAAAGADRILYLSCDPVTQARDLTVLINNGYRLRSMRSFDLFPHTHHIESLAVLERN